MKISYFNENRKMRYASRFYHMCGIEQVVVFNHLYIGECSELNREITQ